MQPTEKKKTEESQMPCEKPEVLKEHQWLHQLIGEWTCEGEAVMGPGQDPMKWTATEAARSVGGVWVVAEGATDTPTGEPGLNIMTLGYDSKTKRFTGSFITSMMTHLWIYDGELDAAGTTLTLNTKGPGMTPDAPYANYRDVIHIKSKDERTLTSFAEGPDGSWNQFMSATYRRR